MKKYRPSNGCEGQDFIDRWCPKCVHNNPKMQLGYDGCQIAVDSMIFGISDPSYPTEWQYGDDGQPTCTKYEEGK